MRNGLYYVVAVLLVLATVPMYRYIFQRARQLDRPAAQPSVVYVPVQRPVVALSPAGVALLGGERCIGGVVVLVSGSTYTQTNGRDGQPVRCAGGRAFP